MHRKKYFKLLILATAVAVSITGPGAGAAGTKERVVVLGFASRQLNDVQDRLLREAVLRELHGRGYRIVPVMEIESLITEVRRSQIRKLSRVELKSLCAELSAGIACCGSIVPEDGSRDEEIKPGKKYLCTLLVYRKDRDVFQEIKVTAVGEKSLYPLFNALSKSIADRFDALP